MVIIQVPRDRDGTFTPVMVLKRRRIFLTVCVVGEDEWTARGGSQSALHGSGRLA
ncbi:hypothetical protein E3T38_14810 [Cryobacterium sp. Hb1]|nr:hypothetical protein E3T38_14810 [Cryobacterium sp. Hb1]